MATSDPPTLSLPGPGRLRLADAPHCRARAGLTPMRTAMAAAAALVVVSGLILFGWYALRLVVICAAVALIVGTVYSTLCQRNRSWGESHALMVGVLIACTLPPMVHWQVAVAATAIAVLVGQLLQGGIGNYLWHPVAIGRVAAQLLFHDQMTPERWPVLAPGRLFSGSLSLSRDLPPLTEWSSAPLPPGVEAWLVNRPADLLRTVLPVGESSSAGAALSRLIRDALPPWPDTLWGTAGGAVGEACVVAILLVGLLLAWQGWLRWSMVLPAFAIAALAVLILPVHVAEADGTIDAHWLPGLAFHDGLPVGLVYTCFQLTAGAFPLVVILLAADPTSSPLLTRGYAIFGLILGVTTMILRIGLGLPAAPYWALLIANTCVPLIDRLTRRRVFGTT